MCMQSFRAFLDEARGRPFARGTLEGVRAAKIKEFTRKVMAHARADAENKIRDYVKMLDAEAQAKQDKLEARLRKKQEDERAAQQQRQMKYQQAKLNSSELLLQLRNNLAPWLHRHDAEFHRVPLTMMDTEQRQQVATSFTAYRTHYHPTDDISFDAMKPYVVAIMLDTDSGKERASNDERGTGRDASWLNRDLMILPLPMTFDPSIIVVPTVQRPAQIKTYTSVSNAVSDIKKFLRVYQ